MTISKLTLGTKGYPDSLARLHSPPKQLFYLGAELGPILDYPKVAIVGSRLPSAYGKQVTTKLAQGLAEQGVVIISGLAIGVDGLSHEATLEAGGTCIAVLPSPLNRIYPSTNRRLAQRILDNGGILVSEYEDGEINYRSNFIARNRIIAGLCDAVLITEAAERSGSRHTLTYARDLGKTVYAVPGNITSRSSVGTNNFLKGGATVATEVADVLQALNIYPHKTKVATIRGANASEQKLLDLLLQGVSDGDELLERSGLAISEYNQTLTMLEITAKIRALGANQWALY